MSNLFSAYTIVPFHFKTDFMNQGIWSIFWVTIQHWCVNNQSHNNWQAYKKLKKKNHGLINSQTTILSATNNCLQSAKIQSLLS